MKMLLFTSASTNTLPFPMQTYNQFKGTYPIL